MDTDCIDYMVEISLNCAKLTLLYHIKGRFEDEGQTAQEQEEEGEIQQGFARIRKPSNKCDSFPSTCFSRCIIHLHNWTYDETIGYTHESRPKMCPANAIVSDHNHRHVFIPIISCSINAEYVPKNVLQVILY